MWCGLDVRREPSGRTVTERSAIMTSATNKPCVRVNFCNKVEITAPVWQ